MDGSYLFQPEVILASRQFVCVRLISYENKDEAPFLNWLTRTRSGQVENSSFGMLSPDGKNKLVFAMRGIEATYADSKAMAEGMNKLAAQYKSSGEPAALPLTADVRIGLDVASADQQPFVALVEPDEAKRKQLEADVAKLAWSAPYIGRFVYASTGAAKDLAAIDGVKSGSTVVVVQPDKFGLKGKVIAQAASVKDAPGAFDQAIKSFLCDTKSLATHVREGRQQGIFWETKTPVTDPMEAAARERSRPRQ